MLANPIQCFYPWWLCTSRLSWKSGTYQNWGDTVSESFFTTTSTTKNYSEGCLASSTRILSSEWNQWRTGERWNLKWTSEEKVSTCCSRARRRRSNTLDQKIGASRQEPSRQTLIADVQSNLTKKPSAKNRNRWFTRWESWNASSCVRSLPKSSVHTV